MGIGVATLLVLLGAVPPSVAVDGSALHVGDYAIYTFGEECGLPDQPVYSPMFGYEGRIWLDECPVTVRWDVVDISGGVALIRFRMDGWSRLAVFLADAKNPSIVDRVYASLTAEHTLRVELATMDVTTTNGTRIGRFGWLLTPGEAATGRAELVRNWYQGRTIAANVTVTQWLLTREWTDAARAGFGTETFVWAQTASDEPFPAGLDKYTVTQAGGWTTLLRSGPIYHPTELLLLFALGAFYSDVLFNLYGIIWLYPAETPWANYPYTWSSMRLLETNIVAIPGSGPSEGGGGGGGTNNTAGAETGSGPPALSPTQPPWVTIGLFAVAAVAVVILAAERFRPRKRAR